MGGGRRIQAARPRVSDVRLNRRQSQPLHECLRSGTSALQDERHHPAAAVRHVLHRAGVVRAGRQVRIADRRHLRLFFEELRDRHRVLAVARHPHMQALQPQIEDERILRGLHAAQIAHQLAGAFGDVCPRIAEFLGVGDAVVAFVWRAEPRILLRVRHPVEIAAVHDDAAERSAVAVHVLCRRVGHNVRAPANRLAVDGRGEGVVHNQRNAVPMRRLSEFLNVQHGQRGIGNRFAEHGARVRAEGAVKFVVRRVGGDEGGRNSHLLQRHGN